MVENFLLVDQLLVEGGREVDQKVAKFISIESDS
jgi:hypothetical protein